MIWTYFKLSEFACRCGRCQNLIDHNFVDKLHDLREALEFPFIITSGYRCPVYNRKVSGTGLTGPHTTGHVADISVSHERAFKLIQLATVSGFTGIGVQQKGAGRFIHLDDLPNAPGQPRPTIWSY